jgi:sirohydrochlorin cobaltochelatase
MPLPTGYLLLAHGSRDPAWSAPFESIAARVRARAPGAAVEAAYLEHSTPSFQVAADRLAAHGARRVRVVPLFLGVGGHVRNDVPRLIAAAAAKHPGIAFELAPSLGESAAVGEAIAAWIAGGA